MISINVYKNKNKEEKTFISNIYDQSRRFYLGF